MISGLPFVLKKPRISVRFLGGLGGRQEPDAAMPRVAAEALFASSEPQTTRPKSRTGPSGAFSTNSIRFSPRLAGIRTFFLSLAETRLSIRTWSKRPPPAA